jgi:nickel-dependent lactate racemase
MNITLPYGLKTLSFSIDSKNIIDIIAPDELPPIRNLKKYIIKALYSPIESLPFNKIFKRGNKVLIIVSDITRYTGSELFLPFIIEHLNEIGINNISILIATALHRKQKEKDIKRIVGESVYRRIKAFNHNPYDRDEHIYLGKTSRGTDVWLNKNLFKVDHIILTGSINFHYFAGFGGGRKGIFPGVAYYESIIMNHKLVFNTSPLKGKHPKAMTGILDGNPVHEDMEEACKNIKSIFLFNTIISSKKEIINIFSGNYIRAHREGCKFLIKNFSCKLKEKGDMVIVSCGGFPKDINFIQAHKSMEHASYSLKENGVMIFLAECSEGFGNSNFINWFRHSDLMEFEDTLREDYEISGQTAYSTLMKAKKYNIIFISNLKRKDIERMSLIPASSMDEALNIAKNFLPKNPGIYIIPSGNNILPILEGEYGVYSQNT